MVGILGRQRSVDHRIPFQEPHHGDEDAAIADCDPGRARPSTRPGSCRVPDHRPTATDRSATQCAQPGYAPIGRSSGATSDSIKNASIAAPQRHPKPAGGFASGSTPRARSEPTPAGGISGRAVWRRPAARTRDGRRGRRLRRRAPRALPRTGRRLCAPAVPIEKIQRGSAEAIANRTEEIEETMHTFRERPSPAA